ncbi:MAG: rhomboid family intramembrane serine protease [Clostridium sp.]
MKKTYKDRFIATMMNNFNYSLVELEASEEYKVAWALRSEENQNEKKFVVFLDEDSMRYYRYYVNIILGNTEGSVDISAAIFCNNSNKDSIFKNASDALVKGVLINEDESSVIALGRVSENLIEMSSLIVNHHKKNHESRNTKIDKITTILIAINVIIYAIAAIISLKQRGVILEIDNMTLYKLGANVNIGFIEISSLYRFVTSIFLHGGLMHLVFNMYALYSLGPLVSKVFGNKKYLFLYFSSGILSSFVSSLFLRGISIGASGAIFGLLGAVLIYSLKNKDIVGKGFIQNILIVIALNLVMGMSIPNIDQMGHIGGLIGGIIGAMVLQENNNSKGKLM